MPDPLPRSTTVSPLARFEARAHIPQADGSDALLHADLTQREVFAQTSLREPALSSACQAGMVNNLNDGLAWGLFPLLFATAGLSVGRIGVLAALYPAVWGFGQLGTGALSDRIGRKALIVGGISSRPWPSASLQLLARSRSGPSVPCCSEKGPPWSTHPARGDR